MASLLGEYLAGQRRAAVSVLSNGIRHEGKFVELLYAMSAVCICMC